MDRLLLNVMQSRSRIETAFSTAVATQAAATPAPNGAMLDDAAMEDNEGNKAAFEAQQKAADKKAEDQKQLDSATTENTASVFTDEMRRDAVNVVQEWADSELDAGEGFGDRLFSLIVGTASDGNGGELTDDEADYAGSVAELVGDYLEDKGVPDDDIQALMGDLDFPNDVAARVHDMLLDLMPQGDDAMTDDAEKFVEGDDDEKMLDATYKKVVAIRAGKKVRIKKRVGGAVHLTAGQKAAVRKMQRKAFSGAAKMKRAKSMRIRMRALGK